LGDLKGKIRAADVWRIVDKPHPPRTHDDNFRLGLAMRELGWERTMRRFDGPPVSAYVRGTPSERRVPLCVSPRCPVTGNLEIHRGLLLSSLIRVLSVKGITRPVKGD
jgi:hypothetical protein